MADPHLNNNNGQGRLYGQQQPQSTRSFTSKVQSALSEIAELKAKYNISSSASSSTSAMSKQKPAVSTTYTGVVNPPRQRRTGNHNDNDASTTSATPTGDDGGHINGEQLHDTLHVALAEIARIQNKYNVNPSATAAVQQPTHHRSHDPRQQKVPRQQRTGHGTQRREARGDDGDDTDYDVPVVFSSSFASPNKHGGSSGPGGGSGNNGDSGSRRHHHRQQQQQQRQRPLHGEPPELPSELSQKLSALTMADLDAGRAHGRGNNGNNGNGNGHGYAASGGSASTTAKGSSTAKAPATTADYQRERTRRRKLEDLLRRSAQEIRSLQVLCCCCVCCRWWVDV